MALLDAFIMQFVTEGLDDIPDSAKEADKQLDNLADTTEDLEEKTKKLSDIEKNLADESDAVTIQLAKQQEATEALKEATVKAAESTKGLGKDGLAQFLVNGVKQFSPYIIALNLLKNTFSNLQDAMDLKLPISRDTVNNIKDLEMTMRDIRSGTAQIGASIAEVVLPVMNKLANIAKVVLDFFKEHEQFIKVTFITTIIAMGAALWGVLSPILPELIAITAVIAGISLLIDDFITWLNGGNSALEDFWNEIFGSADEAKQFLNDLWNTLKELWQLIQPALKWLLDVALKELMLALQGIAGILKQIIEGIKYLKDVGIANSVDPNVSSNLQQLSPEAQEKLKSQGYEKNKNGEWVKPRSKNAHGLDYVPADDIYYLHEGERVQTRAEADDWRSGLIAAKRAINFTSQFPLNSIPQGSISNAYSNSNSNRTIQIGDITIQTQATSAQGIADDLASAIKRAVISLDDGMLA